MHAREQERGEEESLGAENVTLDNLLVVILLSTQERSTRGNVAFSERKLKGRQMEGIHEGFEDGWRVPHGTRQ